MEEMCERTVPARLRMRAAFIAMRDGECAAAGASRFGFDGFQRLTFFKIITVNSFDLVSICFRYANIVLNHQFGQTCAVNQDDPL